ncbi:exostosin domain-containing protein [Winogradskyella undariae]|uniref:exostosin domain-containing protein n=1 Tax=Winogradskyella undariae TaxID=1285465 RepID=UPI0015C6D870|nr:exostosin family protein [Winogradskyella undariae]
MIVFIPDINFASVNRKRLFVLTRPFYLENAWGNQKKQREQWGVSESFLYASKIELADVYFIPLPINQYSKIELEAINILCDRYNICGYGYVSGDYGRDFGAFSKLTFFRMGGFKSQLSTSYKGFPVPLSDHYKRLYKTDTINLRTKQSLPVVGFCGHAHMGLKMRFKEIYKDFKENVSRVKDGFFRKDYEPLFASAYQRAKLLQALEADEEVATNFIYRTQYRAGALNIEERERTTKEYYENINQSDYVLCIRGAGNFSVRLYETLMMGRIPVFLNTDCMLPFEQQIDWKSYVVWVEWKDRYNLAQKIKNFHDALSVEDFKNLQYCNRSLWKNQLSVGGMLNIVSHYNN